MSRTPTALRAIRGSTALTAFWMFPGVLHGGPSAFFTGLGDLPGGIFQSEALAVSDDGTTVVGSSRRPDSGQFSPSFEAFVWREDTGMIGLGDPGAAFPVSRARGVSQDGSVVVGSATGGPFRWTQATGTQLLAVSEGTLQLSAVTGISGDASAIIGNCFDPNGTGTHVTACRWAPAENPALVSMGTLPGDLPDSHAWAVSTDGTVVVGETTSGPIDVQVFRWTAQTGLVGLGDVPGGFFYSLPYGMSGDGTTVVGPARATSSDDEAFVWRAETGFVLLDPLHAAEFGSSAHAASADGSVVVGYDGNIGGPLIWDAKNGRRNLQQMLADDFGLTLPGWDLLGARDISADGKVIVGTGRNPQGDIEAWLIRLPPDPVTVPAMNTAAPYGASFGVIVLGVWILLGFRVGRPRSE